MKSFRELYTENEGLKNDERYTSVNYQMNRFNPENEQLEKAFYIADKVQKRDKLREILSEKKATTTKRQPLENPKEWKKHFDTAKDYTDYLENERLIFGVWVWQSYKRETEIICYLDTLINEADKLAQSDQYKAVCYLIEQKYFYHTGILDEPKADFIFRNEINQIIFDYLQLKINDILKNNEPPQPITELIQLNKKPLYWNANKYSLGTLFGLLHQHNIITGSKADIIRVLAGSFQNVSKATLKDNLNFKKNEDEGKNYFCIDTPDLLTDWIAFLESCTTKPK